MSKRLLLFVTVFATAVAMLTPVASAEELELQLAAPSKAVEESPTGSYIVVMNEAPLIASVNQADLNSSEARSKGEGLKKGHDKALERAGASASDKVNTYVNALNGFSALLSYKQAQALAADPAVFVVLPDELRQLDTNSSPAYLGLTQDGGAYDSGLTGEGVIVGVIDTGIWPEHPSFADDGSYSDLGISLPDLAFSTACEFGNDTHNPDDADFECNNKLLGARQAIPTYRTIIGAEDFEFDSARDDDGHGTHTASTAAGNAGVAATMYRHDLGEISGIAPRARVIAYKGLGALGGFTSDLALAIDTAVADGVDVINYSVGGGASAPTGADDIAFLFAADAGVFAATSAGNSGPGPGTVGSPGNAPWITTVGANTQPRFYEGEIRLSGKKSPTFFGASLTNGSLGMKDLVDAEDAGGDLCIPGTLDPDLVEGNIVLCRRGLIARADKSVAVAQAGGVGMILYNNSDDDNLFTDTHVVPSVHIDNTPGLEIKAYIDSAKKPKALIKKTGTETTWDSAPSMTIFSSRGPNLGALDIIKPDITAPGLQIVAGDSPYANALGQNFQAIAGTSMSSPHVAGLFALLKQAHPDWSAAAARSALMTTADPDVRDNDRVSQATPFGMGSGEADPGRVSDTGSAFNPGLVYDAGLFEYAAYTCGADLGIFTPGSCVFLDGLGIPFDTSDLNYPSIGIAEVPGSQTVVRTVTSVAAETVTYTPTIEAPAGFSVSVSPGEITVAPGDSASYEVTITNVSAPAGEWRFGELTLEGGGYAVRSPIAVAGVALVAPGEVGGTGPDGGTSFDVIFGYTGDYTAAGHGLEPATLTSDFIDSDPDQTYPSPDDGDGVDKHDFVVPAGTAYVRWELMIPGDDDIDLFLEDSGGNIVAQSTQGGTNELIELVLPAADTYTMVVHGWSAGMDDFPYTMSSWMISATPGGSLVVDSAPASATTGATGTVDISWLGAPGGTSYGAVSHSDGGGLISLTLVRVETP